MSSFGAEQDDRYPSVCHSSDPDRGPLPEPRQGLTLQVSSLGGLHVEQLKVLPPELGLELRRCVAGAQQEVR